MSEALRSELAPTGVLRAGINMANFLLVTGRREDGAPQGVAPDMAGTAAERLGVEVAYVPYETPGQLADDATKGVWDIGLIGAEPARAEHIAFTAAYVEIDATYMVAGYRHAEGTRGRGGVPARVRGGSQGRRPGGRTDRAPQRARAVRGATGLRAFQMPRMAPPSTGVMVPVM